MNRRSILKAIGTLPFLSVVGCKDKQPQPKVSKWIAFTDQMPEESDKFEMRKKRYDKGPVVDGEILKFKNQRVEVDEEVLRVDTYTDGSEDIYIDQEEEKEIKHIYITRVFVMHRTSKHCASVIDIKKWVWRYTA